MRATLVVLVLLLAGFDHAAHDARAPLECAKCHPKGRQPRHKQCFGACHGAAPKKKAKKTGPVCEACHGATTDDIGVTVSHDGHADAATCTDCHGPTKHARCMTCHRTTAPTADECTGCHVAGPSPALVPGPMALGAWSHDAHDKKAPKTACTTCHVDALAAPPKSACASCHQTTDACTTCHKAAPKSPPALVRPTERFSHDSHRDKVEACATCHGIDRRGEATVPGHAACAGTACHAADFASRTPKTCASCHTAIEPWRALIVDAPPKPRTEFGAEMPHRTHASLGLTCAGCHADADADRQMRPPHGHASCSGDACHSATLSACEDCHRPGVVAARVQERLGARWTVRARFDHAPHTGDCTSCHASVWNTDGAPATPAKKTCETCHDGKSAFKMTGHGCARCHGG